MSTIRFIFTDFLPAATRHIGEQFGEVVKNDCNERHNRPVSFSHFLPYTSFESGVDLSNGDQYWEDNPYITRLKCLGLVAATPILHAIGLVLNLANRIAKIVSFAHFWHSSSDHYSLSEKSWSFGKDLLRIAFSPIIYIGLELSALYGLILPDNGRKLYATFERCAYGKELLAPCFQPYATRHLGGGVPGKRNEW
ncbi:MAG: hypothetical protein A3D96_05270 [Chlamydiae bacterium RIFCSPHIGHO2_12_FULL_44_59]|nr:MAG: hypothetical protein A2796_03075 [Chlamydiae bacterium RIFCSPHIGHO2_01_FULL_44_39]OGN57676.1 MAG: hypothetical protein A3C42_06665 [Chlamydiae bacterium RIFCSPHIGHO2_02_FULL_45_9]OGN60224.1 MAG: hypothetical protein A3D96_05270 [Chlamydiae bacterium RIFCSPHIGHO2_12_FULL_44_59]OGN67124.1 MAG: hypothetical protein A2978_00780 [Chlamydiae bacterium RIFCSPLOWO2_01_FULL_44_52]OGN67714.1 MAG: hypothetical protein A3I67_04715 [Chlamydiae bacterium RIFCSPLOWO2_02_FULL_45_22]OGN71417.1 MAG: hyp